MLNTLLKPENVLFIPVFLIIISVLVAAHEYGHYLFAKLFGMGIEEFAIGFGRKPILVYRQKKYLVPIEPGQIVIPHKQSLAMHGEMSSLDRQTIESIIVDTPAGKAVQETTNFTVRPWPLGGFVRIKGMIPEEDGSETNIPGGFYSKAPWKRFIVLLAGPVFSVLAGVILVFLLFVFSGEAKPNPQPVVGQILKHSPAEAAGLKEKDRIISIDNAPVNSFFDVIKDVRSSAGKHLTIVYSRNGIQHSTVLTPEMDSEKTPVLDSNLDPTDKTAFQAKMGAYPDVIYQPVSIAKAASESIQLPGRAIAIFGSLLSKPAELKQAVGGPITMLSETRQAVNDGLGGVISLAAMLSISVGIFNLLPVPPLDGGQMAIAVAEMLRQGRRLSMRVQNAVAATGMVLVLTLVMVVMVIDIQRVAGPSPDDFRSVTPVKAKK